MFLLASDAGSLPHGLLQGAPVLLLLSVILILGAWAGSVAHKYHMPALTGQIVMGIIIGPSVLDIIGVAEEHTLAPLTNFAIGLIAVNVGSHLDFKHMHNSYRRILMIAVAEASLAFIAVFFIFEYLNPFALENESARLAAHLIIASIACATSPASALHVIKEKNAKGTLVKTMVGVIAIDNIICLAAFEISQAISIQKIEGTTLIATLLPGIFSFLLALLIGWAIGNALNFYTNKLSEKFTGSHGKSVFNSVLFTLMLISIMLCDGVCRYLTHKFAQLDLSFTLVPSPLMANMTLGLVLANKSSFKDRILEQFSIMEQAVFTGFFILAGMHLKLADISVPVLFAALCYLVAMSFGKLGGAWFGSLFTDCTKRVSRYIGRVLLVQAGMSIALIIVVSGNPVFDQFSSVLTATILTCVVCTELLGTIIMAKTLDKAQESHKARTRLIDFLDEQYILPTLFARGRWEAIEEVCHFMTRTHRMSITADELYEKVCERERKMPTGIGEGIAVPHAMIESGEDDQIRGVLALADPPVDFDAPDGIDARIIILIITPKNHHERHLQVIAAIARMMQQEKIRDAILAARSAAEIYEIIHSEEAENFNYFLS